MSRSDDFYTPERVDEQIDALLHTQETSTQDQRMASYLRPILFHLTDEQKQADEQALQRVLQKYLSDPRFTREQGGNVISSPGRIFSIKKQEKPVVMKRTSNPHSFTRALAVLAAALVVVALVGSMALLIHATRPAPDTQPGASQGNTPTPSLTPMPALREGQIIYTSSAFFLGTTPVWSPIDGTRVATSVDNGDNTTVESWDALTGKNVIKYEVLPSSNGIGVSSIAWSPDGSTLAVCEGSTIHLFDAGTGRPIRTLSAPALATGGATNASLAGVTGPTPLSSAIPLSGGVALSNVVWSPDETEIAGALNTGIYPSPGARHAIYVWNVTSGQVVKTIPSDTYIPSVSWMPKGSLFAAFEYSADTNAANPTLAVWNSATWTKVQIYPNISALDWSPDGTQLALGIEGQTPKAWQAGSPTLIRIMNTLNWQQEKQLTVDTGASNEIHWSPNGTRLLLGTGTTLSIWDVSSGKKLYQFHGSISRAACDKATWSPDSRYVSGIESAGGQERILVWVA